MTTLSGTNTEKIDQLIAAVAPLRTTIRLCLAGVGLLLGLGLPIVIGLTVFLVTQTFQHSARLERLAERLGRIEKTLDRLDERLGRIEKPAKP
jgi:hypothetical protein